MTLESPDGVEDFLTADDTNEGGGGGGEPQNQQEKKEEAQEKVHQRRGETGCPPVPAGPKAAKEPGSGEEDPRADHQN